jgi:hypothetical protein
MPWVEPIAGLIVLAWLVQALRRAERPAGLLLAYGLVFTTAWASEQSCIELYGFYAYSPDWSVFLGHVPLMVALIWPVVVISAWSIVRAVLGPVSPLAPLALGALVLTDAALIEPVCVHAGLWHWTHPGLFEVPPIGVLGWAFYAGLIGLTLERLERGPRRWLPAAVLCIPGTHLLLLAAWWGLFRWVEGSIPPWPAVAVAWALSLTACGLLWRRPAGVPRRLMLDRSPAALFFGTLLLVGKAPWVLVAWALASTPAWTVATGRTERR